MALAEGLLFILRWLIIMALIGAVAFGGTRIYRKIADKKENRKK